MATAEVINAVQQLLETEGVLQSIRAQLRASVITALNSKSSDRKISKANEFLATETGRASMLCVMDLLQKLNLRESLSVFEAEIGISHVQLRMETKADGMIDHFSCDDDGPLLFDLLHRVTSGELLGSAPNSEKLLFSSSRSPLALTQAQKSRTPIPSPVPSPTVTPTGTPRSEVKSVFDKSKTLVPSPVPSPTLSGKVEVRNHSPPLSVFNGPFVPEQSSLMRRSYPDLPKDGPTGDDLGDSYDEENSIEESTSFAAESSSFIEESKHQQQQSHNRLAASNPSKNASPSPKKSPLGSSMSPTPSPPDSPRFV